MDNKFKILIVEDEAIIAQCMRLELEMLGYKVCGVVATGQEAIANARDTSPQLILMDIHLVGQLDGIETAEKIFEHKKVPLIFMTGYLVDEYVERAAKLEHLGYFDKPIEMETIRPIIESLQYH